MTCPSCKGKGYSIGYACPGFKILEIPCDICKGTGQLPDGMIYDPERGRGLKRSRMEPYVGPVKAALERGIRLSELSRMERGYFTEDER